MDEITDDVGGLTLNVKEWRPRKGFVATLETRRPSSGYSARSGACLNNALVSCVSSRGGKSYYM